jgi:amino acid transporter
VAVLATVAISGLFYVLISYASAVGFGQTATEAGKWVGSASPLGELAQRYVGSWLSTIIDAVIILDAMSLAVAIMVTGGRGFYALARDGLLPRPLASLSRYHTPVGGNLVVVVWSIALMLWAGWVNYAPEKTANAFQAFLITTGTGSLCIELIYLLLALVAFRLVLDAHRRDRDSFALAWRLVAVVVAVLTPVFAFWGVFKNFDTFPNDKAVYTTLVCIALAAVWYAYLQLALPDRVRRAAAHAAEHEGVPPLDEPYPDSRTAQLG